MGNTIFVAEYQISMHFLGHVTLLNKHLKSQYKRLWLRKDPKKIENPVLNIELQYIFDFNNMFKIQSLRLNFQSYKDLSPTTIF